MKTTKIKIPSAIPQKQWAINPDAAGGDEYEDMEDIQAYTRRLVNLGFVCVHHNESLSHSVIRNKLRLGKNTEEYSLWYHPEGLFLIMTTYNWGDKCKLGSLHVYYALDLGHGAEAQHRGSVGSPGSGGTTQYPDGSRIRVGNDIIHKNNGSLGRLLEMQQWGKFLPLEKWHEHDIAMPHLPTEVIAPVLPGEDISDKHRWLIEHNVERTQYCEIVHDFSSSLPDPVGAMLIQLNKEKQSTSHSTLWGHTENTTKHFTEAVFLNGDRWLDRNSDESKLLVLWSYVTAGLISDRSLWREDERGPAGLTLAGALVGGNDERTSTKHILLDLISTVKVETLKSWCCDPDATGYTLPLMLLRYPLINDSIIRRYDQTWIKLAFSRMVERLGPEVVSQGMDTDKRSALGIPLEKEIRGSSFSLHERKMRRYADILAHVDSLGLVWNNGIKWRNYPNTVRPSKGEGKPTFFSIPGTVDEAQWKELLGKRWTDDLEDIYSRARRLRLAQVGNHIKKNHEQASVSKPNKRKPA